ncbi:MAG: ABC transporter permease subunit [Phycisphaerales bacterium]|nr:ABC transporter permease subunit [Phycisphaerales bacterium]
MLTGLKRAWESRAARKFRRNRMAVAALAVIALYLAVGLWVLSVDGLKALGDSTGWWNVRSAPLVDALSTEQAGAVVGPLEEPGFGIKPRPEERLTAVKARLDDLGKAFRLRARGGEDREARIRAALAEINYGAVRVADRPVEELRAQWEAVKRQYDTIAESPNLDRDPAALPALRDLEAATAALFTEPGGVRGFLQDFRLSLGTDRQGRSIMVKAVYSIKVAIQIGLVVAIVATLLGALLGAAGAFFGGWVDYFVVWLYSTLSSLPDLVLLGVLVFMFTGSVFDDVNRPYLSLVPLYVAMCLTFWIGPCRIIRGEVLKIKELEYVQAATAIGFSRLYVLIRHALPNTLHLMFINFSLLFIAAIKNEVVLSFLGLGVKSGTSWGLMIQESTQQVINGFYWQIGAATAFMFVLVLAFNILSDALQDAFDPKHVG